MEIETKQAKELLDYFIKLSRVDAPSSVRVSRAKKAAKLMAKYNIDNPYSENDKNYWGEVLTELNKL